MRCVSLSRRDPDRDGFHFHPVLGLRYSGVVDPTAMFSPKELFCLFRAEPGDDVRRVLRFGNIFEALGHEGATGGFVADDIGAQDWIVHATRESRWDSTIFSRERLLTFPIAISRTPRPEF